MPPTHICIVARLMRTALVASLLLVVTASSGCEQLDGRSRNRKGKNLPPPVGSEPKTNGHDVQAQTRQSTPQA